MNIPYGYAARATVLLFVASGYSHLELGHCSWQTNSSGPYGKAVKIEGMPRRSVLPERIWIWSDAEAVILAGWDYPYLRGLSDHDLRGWIEIYRLQRRPKILAEFTDFTKHPCREPAHQIYGVK